MERVEELGGSVHAIEAGFLQREIEEAAWAFHTRIKTKQDVLVGVNEYVEEDGQLDVEILRIDPQTERNQVEQAEALQGGARPRSGRAAAAGPARGCPG